MRPISVGAFKPQAAGSIPAGRIPKNTAISRAGGAVVTSGLPERS
jgi:hypothetical protein